MFWILAIAAIAAVLIAWFLGNFDEEETISVPVRDFDGVGAPLFESVVGRKKVLTKSPDFGEWIWALTPAGPQRMQSKGHITSRRILLENANYVGQAYYDGSYFSESVADSLNSPRGVWRLGTFRQRDGITPVTDYSAKDRRANRTWVRDETIFGTNDDFDDAIFFLFMLNAFEDHVSYYKDYMVHADPWLEPVVVPTEEMFEQIEQEIQPVETPEHPTEVESAPVEIVPEVEPVSAEVTEDVFEQFVPESTEPISVPAPEPIDVEPDRFPSYEPVQPSYDSPSYDSPSYDSYDSGFDSGFDSGSWD